MPSLSNVFLPYFYTLHPQMTVCQRTSHHTFTNPVKSSVAFGWYLGSLRQDWLEPAEGWFYGEWETGPWIGFKTAEKAEGSYG